MDVHLYAWIITAVVTIAILAVDVFIIGRRPHEPSMKEAGLAIGFFVSLAVASASGSGRSPGRATPASSSPAG